MSRRQRRTVIGTMLLPALLTAACQGGDGSAGERQPDGTDGGPGEAGCEMASADDFEAAQMAAGEYFACLHPGVDAQTVCALAPGWLFPAEYEGGDIQRAWTVGRPVVECEALLPGEGSAPQVLGASAQALDPVTFPPLRAPWNDGRLEEVPCLVALLDTRGEPVVSAEAWAARLRGWAECHPQVETVVECWGPVEVGGAGYVPCRLQFIELEAAILKAYPIDR